MPNRCLTSTSFLQEAEIKGDIIINVKDDFFVEPFLGGPHRSKLPRDVRHVDTTGRPQFSVTEERVCEINESRRVYHKFLKEKMDNVPKAFRDDAKKLLDSYQREIARKSKPRAILSHRGYWAGELPSKAVWPRRAAAELDAARRVWGGRRRGAAA